MTLLLRDHADVLVDRCGDADQLVWTCGRRTAVGLPHTAPGSEVIPYCSRPWKSRGQFPLTCCAAAPVECM
jgi:hypothetical protein